MSEAMLQVDRIDCAYDGVPVVHGVSLEVFQGEIVAIVGANGTGKSTVMKAVAGLLHPIAGRIVFLGEDTTRTPGYAMIPKGISYVPEGRRLFAMLTVRENLELGAYTEKNRSVIDRRLEEVFSLFPVLADRAGQVAETLSGGEQQMCAIARGLMSGPRLLMLDELSLGLMPTLVEKVLAAVVEINRQGTTVLLVEQMVQEALEIAARGYVIQTGRIVQHGPARELIESDEVRKAYMGL